MESNLNFKNNIILCLFPIWTMYSIFISYIVSAQCNVTFIWCDCIFSNLGACYVLMVGYLYRVVLHFSHYSISCQIGFWLVEMAISTNQKPTIYRNLYDNTSPGVCYDSQVTPLCCSDKTGNGDLCNKDGLQVMSYQRVSVPYNAEISVYKLCRSRVFSIKIVINFLVWGAHSAGPARN